jgi:hypothetical protein
MLTDDKVTIGFADIDMFVSGFFILHGGNFRAFLI